MSKTSYFLQLFIFSALIALLIIILKQLFPGEYIHHAIWIIFIFYIILTTIVHFIFAKPISRNSSTFITAIFGYTGLKLLLSIAFLIFYLMNDRTNPIWFSVNFIILYLSFTAFEIYFLLRNLRTL
jgi:hypothetical protein